MLRVWSTSSGELTRVLVAEGETIRLDDQTLRIRKQPEMVYGISATADGGHVITHHQSGVDRIWKCSDWSLGARVTAPTSEHGMVVVRRDGAIWHVGAKHRTVHWFDMKADAAIGSFTVDDAISAWCVSSDGAMVVAGDTSGRMHFLRLMSH